MKEHLLCVDDLLRARRARAPWALSSAGRFCVAVVVLIDGSWYELVMEMMVAI
ncbi:hypothetical protein [Prosthecobacter sp.]|uniref:hypothetical protein n=1 Tax=Prosthecobacter sp. TaxID=1965333 RepID=UPI003784AD87